MVDESANPCLFCDPNNRDSHQIIAQNAFVYARWDNFPVSRGHLEVIPRRHVVSFFDLRGPEVVAIYLMLREAESTVEERFNPDGYNIGVNDGVAAGRTIHHLHVHLIPRYLGDVPVPRGGVRNIIPGLGDY